MIVFISSEHDDYSTNNVLDWFVYHDVEVIRINENDDVQFISLEYDENHNIVFKILINGKKYFVDNKCFYWYRRGFINFLPENQINISQSIATILQENHKINRFISEELDELTLIFNSLISEKENKNAIGAYSNNYTIKLNNLRIASKKGLKIPKTKVLTRKEDVLDFYVNSKNGIITKAIRHGLGVFQEDVVYEGFTKEMTLQHINDLPLKFFPTLFQEKVDKLFEVRTFYLCGKFYSMAIFSQQDTTTKIDFRNYNREKPNRTPPFKLPSSIEKKLRAFLDTLEMKSGSIDLLVTPKLEYVFLEINPIGQYSQVSIPCNYHLDYVIFNELKNNS